jgi:Na+/melibiose symporter-like transporter
MGTFYSPNSSSILSAVERERHGVISALLNLIRNAGNVISVAVSTAIVTATMGAMGYEPNLDAVRTGAGSGVGEAFTMGLKYAYMIMACSMLLAMFVSLLPLNRVQYPEYAIPQPES